MDSKFAWTAIVAIALFPMLLLDASAQSGGARTPSPPGARVYFPDLKDGATVPSRFTVKFGAENVDIVPAGENKPRSGHHHLLIDTPSFAPDQPIPSDVNQLHF